MTQINDQDHRKNTGKRSFPDISMHYQSRDFWEYCDNCGERLIVRKCEFVCPKCGFFHSCSEP